jgi:hypothetical protein
MLRNRLTFGMIKEFVFALLTLIVMLAVRVLMYPFQRNWSAFDALWIWYWVYHWNKPTLSWGFFGYAIGMVILSAILTAIAEKVLGDA